MPLTPGRRRGYALRGDTWNRGWTERNAVQPAERREPVARRIEQDRTEDGHPRHHLVGLALNPGEVHAILDHRNVEGADHRAGNAAFAAGEPGAA